MTANTTEIKSTIKYLKPLEIEELHSFEIEELQSLESLPSYDLSSSSISDDNYDNYNRSPSTTSKCSKCSGKWSSSMDEYITDAFFEESDITEAEEKCVFMRKIYNRYIGNNIKKFCSTV